ncbi:MAG: MlaE family lipid ABC transporter permease subunit [Alphaproteobacteria bacterium]
MAGDGTWLETWESDGRQVIAPVGRWAVGGLFAVEKEIRAMAAASAGPTLIDLAKVEVLDTAGAWTIYRTARDLEARGIAVDLVGVNDAQAAMIEAVRAAETEVEPDEPTGNSFVNMVEHVGRSAVDIGRETADLLGFFGLILTTAARALTRPHKLRTTSLFYHMEEVGLNAIPIVGLMAFLIGIVLAFQGASQLQRFGAEVFVVNLVAVSVLREIGVLMTAIIVAGRSGSAFTAQIGSMKVNEEVDAMQTLGLDPIEVLVLPRLFALVLTLPLLAFFADIMGLVGGGLMAWIALDISPATFIERLRDAVSMWSFWVGILKAPFFAFMIAMIGCYEGFQVTGSATSVGQRTTRAVVEAIFLVIVIDAAFSIFFQVVGI